MIRSFKNTVSEKVFHGERPRKLTGLDFDQARARLDYLDSIEDLSDIPALKSLSLHGLKGSRKGQWAISVNGPWRICFKWEGGDVCEVEITDYH